MRIAPRIIEVEQGWIKVLEEQRLPVLATEQVVDDDLVAMDGIRDWAAGSRRHPAPGLGREGGHDALHFFTESKNICIRY